MIYRQTPLSYPDTKRPSQNLPDYMVIYAYLATFQQQQRALIIIQKLRLLPLVTTSGPKTYCGHTVR